MQFPSNWTEDCISDTDRLNYCRVAAAAAFASALLSYQPYSGEFRVAFALGTIFFWDSVPLTGAVAWNIYRTQRPEEREPRIGWNLSSHVNRHDCFPRALLGLLKMQPGTITCSGAWFCFLTDILSGYTGGKLETAALYSIYLFDSVVQYRLVPR